MSCTLSMIDVLGNTIPKSDLGMVFPESFLDLLAVTELCLEKVTPIAHLDVF